jgi:hypothetical protein
MIRASFVVAAGASRAWILRVAPQDQTEAQ